MKGNKTLRIGIKFTQYEEPVDREQIKWSEKGEALMQGTHGRDGRANAGEPPPIVVAKEDGRTMVAGAKNRRRFRAFE